ncbi:lipopolysaccharide cholinephosphotransferase, partial [Francisella tularensis]|nr:lipopolysaccharide cholinephosphotransferase [Francisella tularensis]MWX35365.1 lipopolysaccharide cholinephosphotransferase [Francisella tularensis]
YKHHNNTVIYIKDDFCYFIKVAPSLINLKILELLRYFINRK